MRQFVHLCRRKLDHVVDRALVRGSFLAVALLLIGSIFVVFVGALVVAVGHINLEVANQDESVIETAWQVLLRAMSPDQLMTNTQWDARVVLLSVTVVGLLLVSTLISILNSVIERRMEFIHRGRGEVNLRDHLVILNWNQFGYRVIREIAQSAEPNHSPLQVSILCNQDPIELMHEIRDALSEDIRNDSSRLHRYVLRHPENWIVARRGKATNTADLSNLTSVALARSVIVLTDPNLEVTQLFRVVLAVDSVLSQEPPAREGITPLPLITFTNSHGLALMLDQRLAYERPEQRVQRRKINYIPLSAEEIRHGIETQVSRHRGLSAVYQDLLNFGNQELYIVKPATDIATFGEAVTNSLRSTPVGVVKDGVLDLWPDWEFPLVDTQLITLAAHHSEATLIATSKNQYTLVGKRRSPEKFGGNKERFLFLGWGVGAARLAESLERILPAGSTLTVVPREDTDSTIPKYFCSEGVKTFSSPAGDPLADLTFFDSFDHVIVFSDDTVSAETSDAAVLIDLLSCRRYANTISDPDRRFTIVAELKKRSSRYIAGERLADDLLINDTLLASAAVQLAFSPDLESVFNELLSEENPVELITRPISFWKIDLNELQWNTFIAFTCEQTGEIPIGFRRLKAGKPEVVLNPKRDTLCEAGDEIVLLSRRTPS